MRLLISTFTILVLACTAACGVAPVDSAGGDGIDNVNFTPPPSMGGDGDGDGPEVAEENPCQGMPGGCLDIGIAVQVGLKPIQDQAALNEAHEAWAQELRDSGVYPNATKEEVAQQWKDTVGSLTIAQLDDNLPNLNKFLQFVRVSRGPVFDALVTGSSEHNYYAQVLLEFFMDPPKLSTLEDIVDRVELQKLWLEPMKVGILRAAAIYGVKLQKLDESFDSVAGPFASEVTDSLAEKIVEHFDNGHPQKGPLLGKNLALFVQLHELIENASVFNAETGQYVSFVTFLRYGTDELAAPNGEYKTPFNRLYGAFDATQISFIE